MFIERKSPEGEHRLEIPRLPEISHAGEFAVLLRYQGGPVTPVAWSAPLALAASPCHAGRGAALKLVIL